MPDSAVGASLGYNSGRVNTRHTCVPVFRLKFIPVAEIWLLWEEVRLRVACRITQGRRHRAWSCIVGTSDLTEIASHVTRGRFCCTRRHLAKHTKFQRSIVVSKVEAGGIEVVLTKVYSVERAAPERALRLTWYGRYSLMHSRWKALHRWRQMSTSRVELLIYGRLRIISLRSHYATRHWQRHLPLRSLRRIASVR